ncbi:MAG: pyrroline-5-carboxylate reductase [Propionibacteriaceae bacterium]|nr:pyrroline-5-carboxylate reductase [Propionibacteriaceae bacterium]
MTDLSSITGDVAIVGVGNMGGAILTGLMQAGLMPQRIRAAAHTHTNQVAAQYGVVPAKDPAQAAVGASVVIVAVKPPKVREVVAQMAPQLSPGSLLISVAAGIATRDLEAWAQTHSNPTPAVVRAIPNTPAKLRQGVTAMSRGSHVSEGQLLTAQTVFGAIGAVVTVDESIMPAVSAVSGCGPAYLFLVAEAMTEAGVRLGLPRDTAAKLVTQTFVGSSALMATGQSPNELRAEVTSPGGTTAAAIFELEDRGVRAAFSAAMKATVDRTKELSN